MIERATGTEHFERVVLGSLSKVTRPRNWTAVDVTRMRSKSKNTPFDGWHLRGGVAATIVGGRVVHETAGFGKTRAP